MFAKYMTNLVMDLALVIVFNKVGKKPPDFQISDYDSNLIC